MSSSSSLISLERVKPALSSKLILMLAACFGLVQMTAHGQSPTPAAGPAPTVTAEMGDVGGKYFGKTPDPAKTRHYYIAAEPELWNFAPLGEDPVCGKTFPPAFTLNRLSWKIRYVQYTDATFTARALPTGRLGILGPVLRGVTGQYLAVTFLNRSTQPLSMHPHGVRYDKDNEGSYYQPAPGLGAAVAPGAKFTYVWYLDADSGPRLDEPSSKAWLYHSHVAGDEETNLGLIGFIVVTDAKRARPDGTPNDVDREMAALFKIFDEPELGQGEAVDPDDLPPGDKSAAAPLSYADALQKAEEGQRYTLNGLSFGNLGGLEMNQGERVRWYLFGLGSESDFHTAHWHGERVTVDGRSRSDVVELLPASMHVADMVADDPGQWIFHCHVAEHMQDGMFARFTIYPTGTVGASAAPEVAFFGMPQALQTLHFQNSSLALDKKDPAASQIFLDGQVSVPNPFPVARQVFTIQLGSKKIALQPDASGIAGSPDGMLLVKNIVINGNGVVRGGMLKFEITLKGGSWLKELQTARILDHNQLAHGNELPIAMTVSGAEHHAAVSLTAATE
ncbi:MAG: multicopper oxidase domain-containing protein [Chthoniobacteraceae bacterium]